MESGERDNTRNIEVKCIARDYSRPPLSVGGTFQDPQWMLETADNTKPYTQAEHP